MARPRKWDHLAAKAAALRSAGLLYREIAAALGVSISVAYRLAGDRKGGSAPRKAGAGEASEEASA